VEFVWPELGIGYGEQVDGKAHFPVLQFDFQIGAEWVGPRAADGFMLSLGYLGDVTPDEGEKWSRFFIGPLWTHSFGHGVLSPFFRTGVGPQVISTWATRGTAVGAGLQLEAAGGLKGIVEVFVDGFGAMDPFGGTWGATVGLRLNALIMAVIFQGWEAVSEMHSYGRAYRGSAARAAPPPPPPPPAPTVHPASPAR